MKINFLNRKVCVDALRNKEHQLYSKLSQEEKDFYKSLRKTHSRNFEKDRLEKERLEEERLKKERLEKEFVDQE